MADRCECGNRAIQVDVSRTTMILCSVFIALRIGGCRAAVVTFGDAVRRLYWRGNVPNFAKYRADQYETPNSLAASAMLE
jgi:hypothetical protein